MGVFRRFRRRGHVDGKIDGMIEANRYKPIQDAKTGKDYRMFDPEIQRRAIARQTAGTARRMVEWAASVMDRTGGDE